MFWYDQARDFTIVQDLGQGDIKIQGPSASGTNDTLYHGVFYYYLILPAVMLGGGSPIVVATYLSVIGSFSAFIIYALGAEVFKSRKVGLFAALILAFSFLSAQLAIWLSNPQLLGLTVGSFYLFVWRVFFSKPTKKDFILLGISLGLCIQGGIFELYLMGVLIAAYAQQVFKRHQIVIFPLSKIALAIGSFLITISSMIVTQTLLIQRNILTLDSSQAINQHSANSISIFGDIIDLYLTNFHSVLTPYFYISAFVCLLVPVVLGFAKTNNSQRSWFLLLFSAPLWLLLTQYRGSSHLFIGFEIIIYLLFAAGLLRLYTQVYLGKFIAASLLSLFIVINALALISAKNDRTHLYAIQKGALLTEQLALIDETYRLANGQEFSFSSSTNPFNINVTWSYLYNWYGNKKYGYVPQFLGAPQASLVGEGTLFEITEALPLHFTILEPDTSLATRIYGEFMEDQYWKSGSASAEIDFGSLGLQVRDQGAPVPIVY
jgi:hypothetical protein